MRNFQEVKEVGMKEANELLNQGWMIAEIIEINGGARYVMGMPPAHAESTGELGLRRTLKEKIQAIEKNLGFTTAENDGCDQLTPMECKKTENPEVIQSRMREEIDLRIEEASAFNEIATSRAKKLCDYAGRIRELEIQLEKERDRGIRSGECIKMMVDEKVDADRKTASKLREILASRSWIEIHKIAEDLLCIFDKTK